MLISVQPEMRQAFAIHDIPSIILANDPNFYYIVPDLRERCKGPGEPLPDVRCSDVNVAFCVVVGGERGEESGGGGGREVEAVYYFGVFVDEVEGWVL